MGAPELIEECTERLFAAQKPRVLKNELKRLLISRASHTAEATNEYENPQPQEASRDWVPASSCLEFVSRYLSDLQRTLVPQLSPS